MPFGPIIAVTMVSSAAEVRRIRPTEWEGLRDLRLRALVESPTAFGGVFEQEEQSPDEHWRERAGKFATDPAEILFVVAGQDGVLRGMTRGVLSSGPSDAAHLFGMYVGPAFRGQGYGRRLVEEVCEWARRAGEHRIILDVTETNLPAIRLYEACGFARTGRTQPLPHTPALQEIEMECALG